MFSKSFLLGLYSNEVWGERKWERGREVGGDKDISVCKRLSVASACTEFAR